MKPHYFPAVGTGSDRILLLQFAGDTLVFIRTKKIIADKVAKVLNQYGTKAGQHTNLTKFALLFSSETTRADTRAIRNSLGISTITFAFIYLGENIGVRNTPSQIGMLLLSQINNRIHSWRGIGISLVGHRVLLQSVLMAIPQYCMGPNVLHRRFTTKISSSQATFLWTCITNIKDGLRWHGIL